LNSQLVLDVAIADDGSHDLIMWHLNYQYFYFKKVKDNFYYIMNAHTGEYMKKS